MLSDKAQQRIRTCASWLQYFSQGLQVYSKQKRKFTSCKLVFITLTLSSKQNHPDVYIVEHMLQPMLKYLQRVHGCYLYIWKAEVQPERYYKRGERCIHFHITTNRFVHYRQLQNKWNALQKAHGYIKPNTDPHSSEVRAVKNEKGFASYMAKYISKKETDKALLVNCKVWGCSRALSQVRITLGEDTTADFNDTMTEFVQKTSKGEKKLRHATIHFTSLADAKKLPVQVKEAVAVQRDAMMNMMNKKQKVVRFLRSKNSTAYQPEAKPIKPIQLEVQW